MRASDLKNGNALNLDGQIWIVVKTEHVKPGKGGAFTQVKLKNIATGQNVEKRFRSTEDVEAATLDRRAMEYLYSDSSGAVFMDNETYEQTTIHEDILGDAMLYLKPNTNITGLVHEGKTISIELPPTVELEVSDTPPGIKGATATNQLKEATLETGLKTRVPPFISNGEVIKVNTDTGEYLSRA